MNKSKLRGLMFHAGFCNEDGGWDNRPIWEQEHDNFQRFAELIVKECASKVDWILAEGGKTQGDLIRQHFGVEK